MTDKSSLIVKKNLVVCGGTPEARQDFLGQAREAFLQAYPSARVFTLSEHISDSDRYLQSARKEFPIAGAGQAKYEMGYDQLNDSYLDWVKDCKAVLVVIPELQKLYKHQPNYFYQLMGDFIARQQEVGSKSTIRFVISMAEPAAIDVKKVPVLIGGDWRPSEKDLETVVL